MSDDHIPGESTDPIDRAYAQAEEVLADDAARVARRARVLEAVARAEATPAVPSLMAASAPPPQPTGAQRHGWPRGGWLAAACVAGLGLLVVAGIYRTAPFQTPSAPSAPAAPTAPTPPAVTPTLPRAVAPPPTPPAPSKPPQVLASPARPASPEPPPAAPPPAPPPPPLDIAPVQAPSPSPPAPPPPQVTAERAAPAATAKANAAGDAAENQDAVRASANRSSSPTVAPPPLFAAAPRRAALAPDLDARLRAAAAAGRASDVETLLNQGADVDAADAEGNTALMNSIRADHPAVAALLRRHGASPDRTNHAGESARDMAAASGDAALDHAIGPQP